MKSATRAPLLIVYIISLFFLPPSVNAFCFEEAGKEHNINPELLKSIAHVESGLNSQAVNTNKNGSLDLGLMQINSAWISVLNLDREDLITNPCYNVMTGANILSRCIGRHGYTWEAVGCYNARSKGKRVGYSWKIFRELQREKARIMAKKKEASPDTARSVPSLHFRVRDREEPVHNGEP